MMIYKSNINGRKTDTHARLWRSERYTKAVNGHTTVIDEKNKNRVYLLLDLSTEWKRNEK